MLQTTRMVTHMFHQKVICVILAAAMFFAATGSTMSENKKAYEDFMKYDADEGMSMFLRRARHEETISSDIALRLAEMVFIRIYGKEYTDERLPLVIIDRGDRWEVNSREGIPPLQRLKMIIMKTNGRILELVSW
jgi:hypothetical protein